MSSSRVALGRGDREVFDTQTHGGVSSRTIATAPEYVLSHAHVAAGMDSSEHSARVLLMKNTLVSELAKDTIGRRVVTLQHNDTVGDALSVLERNNILSAPVVISNDMLETSADEPVETLIGFFDAQDAVRVILDAVNAAQPDASASEPPVSHGMLFWMREIDRLESSIADVPLIKCLGYDGDLMYTPNSATTTVYSLVVDGFLGGRSETRSSIVHRVALFEPTGEVSRIISQTDVLKWLRAHDKHLSHSLESYTLRQLGFGSEERAEHFVTVDARLPTIECYRIMARERVSGAAITDRDGAIIADVTAGDLRTLTRAHFSILGLPVAEFVALTHGTSYAGYAAWQETPETHKRYKDAFFEKARAAHDRRLDDVFTQDDGAVHAHPSGVLTVEIDSTFKYDWFQKKNKQRAYVVGKYAVDTAFDVVTVTDVLECAVFGHVHRGPRRHR